MLSKQVKLKPWDSNRTHSGLARVAKGRHELFLGQTWAKTEPSLGLTTMAEHQLFLEKALSTTGLTMAAEHQLLLELALAATGLTMTAEPQLLLELVSAATGQKKAAEP